MQVEKGCLTTTSTYLLTYIQCYESKFELIMLRKNFEITVKFSNFGKKFRFRTSTTYEEIFENERNTCEKTDNSGQIYTVPIQRSFKGLDLFQVF